MGIRILKSGMLTTVQDLGRTGYQSQGFSVAGVMDVRSFKIDWTHAAVYFRYDHCNYRRRFSAYREWRARTYVHGTLHEQRRHS